MTQRLLASALLLPMLQGLFLKSALTMRLISMLLLMVWAATSLADPVDAAREQLRNRDPGALATLEALSGVDARNAEVWMLLAQARMRSGDGPGAVTAAERAVRLDADSATAHYTLGQAYGSNINNIGMLGKMRYAGRIRDAFATAVELDPDHLNARQGLMQFYLQAPGIAGGSVSKAREQADAIAQRNPARGAHAHGLLLQSDENIDAAMASWREAIALDSGFADPYYALGYALQRADRWQDAHQVFSDLAAALPDQQGAWYQIGRNSAESGIELDAGAEALLHYLELSGGNGMPDARYVYLRLGQIHQHAGRHAEAGSAYQASLQHAPDFDDARAALAALPAALSD